MENTAKNFALQLGSLVSMYVSITALLMLLFGIITVQYPDAAQGYWEYDSASSSIRFAIALLVVFFPAYVLLTRTVNSIRRNEHGAYLVLTKWLIYLSLLVGGATILGDLVAILNSFLNGELTIRFALKALSFFVIVGTAFVYYLLDARGYWQTHEKHSIQYGIGATILVVIVLIMGFKHTQTPAEVREMRIDTQQITDLQSMQYQIEQYYNLHGALPQTTGDMYLDSGVVAPIASEGRAAYSYSSGTSTAFELCAEFKSATSKTEQMQYTQPIMTGALIPNGNNWNHEAGNWCFKRTIDPSATQMMKIL